MQYLRNGDVMICLSLGHQNFKSPVTPAELLIALHGVDPTKVDVKTIIKGSHLVVVPFVDCSCTAVLED